jgi:hypothetical protein
VIRSKYLVAWTILCATAFGSSTPIGDRGATRSAASLIAGAGEYVGALLASAMASIAVAVEPRLSVPALAIEPDPDPSEIPHLSDAEAFVSEPPLLASAAMPPLETQMQFAFLSTSDPVKEGPKPTMRRVGTPDECLVAEICIDEYLWSLYQRTPKIDVSKVEEQTKETIKKDGKTRTITKTTTKFVLGDFTWKDPAAAQRANMSLKEYVIGGLDRGFKLKLYHSLRAMDDAGFMPGITSAFRDDYRQSIASGNKAASDSSYHGGSRRGGYGHALAATS